MIGNLQHRFNTAPANVRKKRASMISVSSSGNYRTKKDGISSIDLHLS